MDNCGQPHFSVDRSLRDSSVQLLQCFPGLRQLFELSIDLFNLPLVSSLLAFTFSGFYLRFPRRNRASVLSSLALAQNEGKKRRILLFHEELEQAEAKEIPLVTYIHVGTASGVRASMRSGTLPHEHQAVSEQRYTMM